MALAIILGILTGLSLGLTGAGGGILAVPALVLGMGYSMTAATPVALLAVGAAALVGALDGLYKHIVRYRAAMFMAITGALVTSLGVRISHALPEKVLVTLFVAIMLWIATKMLRRPAATAHAHTPCCLNPETGRLRWTPVGTTTLASIGAVAGLFSGMLGVGGGFLIVPALKRFSDLSMHSIVATSLMLIALISLSASAMSLAHGAVIPLSGWVFVASAMGGMVIGRQLAPHIPPVRLQQGFSILTAVVALSMLARTYLF
ncbi:membrane protein [Alcaligenes faecalis]|uniref:sulfite exporter TauE/SafE family protein n=1 Tax=Alcaligenes TaxID=507 RepID=UPI0007C4DFFD|nr:sulfite exporter TauE/SafE family protein [Alcaligenes faecalis]ARP52312.1 membrane protein [Alcaligenes faecalis]MBQ0216404.1 sulfite exporter TauE/SafE family protein [Alcaligenes faecalis]MDK7587087.1 sulfite exporter TauE/SafE family protein [Alcaligenes phenolicus]RSE62715.1 sulfite exporter TauE/SafE family protein [Alcaligenes faecalis]